MGVCAQDHCTLAEAEVSQGCLVPREDTRRVSQHTWRTSKPRDLLHHHQGQEIVVNI